MPPRGMCMQKANLNTIIVNFFQKKQFLGKAHLNTMLVNLYLLYNNKQFSFLQDVCRKI